MKISSLKVIGKNIIGNRLVAFVLSPRSGGNAAVDAMHPARRRSGTVFIFTSEHKNDKLFKI
jgi:hypothetical protein